jgi:hypothetical protein
MHQAIRINVRQWLNLFFFPKGTLFGGLLTEGIKRIDQETSSHNWVVCLRHLNTLVEHAFLQGNNLRRLLVHHNFANVIDLMPHEVELDLHQFSSPKRNPIRVYKATEEEQQMEGGQSANQAPEEGNNEKR